MTEYEIISLHQMFTDSVASHVMNFISIYFAVVVASYFIADKLPKLIVFGIIVMFTTFTALNLSQIYQLFQSMVLLQETLHEVSPHSPYMSPDPSVIGLRPISFVLTYLLGYLTAVGFPLYMVFRNNKHRSL